MKQIAITVEGYTYVVDREALLAWLASNAKTFAEPARTFNEYQKPDEQGRTVLNG